MIIDHIEGSTEPPAYVGYARIAADIVDVDGRKYRSGLDELDIEPDEEPGHYRVRLNSRKGKIVVVAGAALLIAAGVGAGLQFNRTYRKKKKR